MFKVLILVADNFARFVFWSRELFIIIMYLKLHQAEVDGSKPLFTVKLLRNKFLVFEVRLFVMRIGTVAMVIRENRKTKYTTKRN